MKRREAVGHVPCKISRMCAILKLAETSIVLKQKTAVILVTYPRNSHIAKYFEVLLKTAKTLKV